jgi:hypothetical protein
MEAAAKAEAAMSEFRHLEKGEVIQEGDEIDRCADPWRDDPKWEPVHPKNVGEQAPDPAFPSHRQYRRRIA